MMTRYPAHGIRPRLALAPRVMLQVHVLMQQNRRSERPYTITQHYDVPGQRHANVRLSLGHSDHLAVRPALHVDSCPYLVSLLYDVRDDTVLLLFGQHNVHLLTTLPTSQARGLRHRFEVLLILRRAQDLPQFDRHSQRKLAEISHVLFHVLDNHGTLCCFQVIEHGRLAYHLLDSDHQFAGKVEVQVKIERTRYQSFEVRGQLRSALYFAVEVQIGHEHDSAFEVKGIRDRFTIFRLEDLLGAPRNRSTLSRVESALQEIEPDFIVEHGVGIVEHNNAVLMTILPEQFVNARRLDVAANARILNVAFMRLTFKNVLKRVSLPDARVARAYHRSELARGNAERHPIESVKARLDAGFDFIVGAFINDRRRSVPDMSRANRCHIEEGRQVDQPAPNLVSQCDARGRDARLQTCAFESLASHRGSGLE